MTLKSQENRLLPSVGSRIIEGLTELKEALESKEPLNHRFTVRTVELNLEPEHYSGQSIQEIRNRINVSQAVFAQLLGVSTSTIQSWEQGKREPSKMARRLIEEIQNNPEHWLERVKQATRSKPVSMA